MELLVALLAGTNFIELDGRLINLSAVADVEDVSEGTNSKLILAMVTGTEIELDGEDADTFSSEVSIILAQRKELVNALLKQAAIAAGAQP